MMEIYNKYRMGAENNVFVAKRNIVDYIYKSARLEGLGVTFPDTAAIIEGGVTQGLPVNDIVAVNNLKHAWQFVLDNIGYPTGWPFICEINRYVGASLFPGAGNVRKIPVSIGGTHWQPPLPIEADIKDDLLAALSLENATDRALTLMLTIMRRQAFLDGNKRTAMLAANHVMIQNGAGVITVPVELIGDFTKLLLAFYESGGMGEIKAFLFDTSIDGLELENA